MKLFGRYYFFNDNILTIRYNNPQIKILFVSISVVVERRPGKVSAKIQQLLTTLKKPKRKSLAEYFEDDDRELESKYRLLSEYVPSLLHCYLVVVAANAVSPNAPKPEGTVVTPFVGDRLPVRIVAV